MALVDLNTNTADSDRTPQIWDMDVLQEKASATVFEFIKKFTTAVFKQDTNALYQKMYQGKLKAITARFTIEKELQGGGVVNSVQMRGSEEPLVGSTFDFTPQFVRNAVAIHHVDANKDILIQAHESGDMARLARWASKKKEKSDIGRMLSGATNITYGNGQAAAYASITSSHALSQRTFAVLRESLIRNNAMPVEMKEEEVTNSPHPFYIAALDELSLNALLLNNDWAAYIEAFNANAAWQNPLGKVAFGLFNGMLIIKIEQVLGFGSPLRPECILAAAATIGNGADADVKVGIPKWASAGVFTAYDSSVDKKDYTEYFETFEDMIGANVDVVIKQADGTLIENITVSVEDATDAGYDLNIVNGSGGSITLAPGDKIITRKPIALGMAAQSFISSWLSDPFFTTDTVDYGIQNGVCVNFWEGGVNVSDARDVVNGIAVNFYYSALLL